MYCELFLLIGWGGLWVIMLLLDSIDGREAEHAFTPSVRTALYSLLTLAASRHQGSAQ